MPKPNRTKHSARGYLERVVDTREPRQRFLIVCEGKRTEPNYFRGFREGVYADVKGIGENTVDLVRRAIELCAGDDYDQVWCVFDRNDFPPERFNAACVLAKQEGIRVAYSNRAFELWYLLHFDYVCTAMSRDDYERKLCVLLGHEYTKNSRIMYQELEHRQVTAIKHAQQLLGQYSPRNPERDDPSTTVHVLVEELRRSVVG